MRDQLYLSLILFCILSCLILYGSAHDEALSTTTTSKSKVTSEGSSSEGDELDDYDDEDLENAHPSLLESIVSTLLGFLWRTLIYVATWIVSILLQIVVPYFAPFEDFFAYWLDIFTDRDIRLYLTATATAYKGLVLMAPIINRAFKLPLPDSLINATNQEFKGNHSEESIIERTRKEDEMAPQHP